jgi:glycosyltransferase involved in cell wall biosynthesis
MPDPLISICIPAYKAEGFIGETLAGIRAQTFANWEVIIVEDGTHDGTEEIVKAFAQTITQPVVFLRHEQNQGLPATRNTAIGRARGEWIALVDSDDIWTPEHLASAVSRARETGADLVHTGVIMFDSDSGRDLETRAPSAEAITAFPRSLFTGEYIIQPSSVVLRRELCQRVGGFDPNCRYVEDREFWLRLVRAGAKIAHDPALTCRYRQHASAMTKNAAAMAEGVANVFERNADWDAMPRTLRRERAASAWLSAGRIVLRDNPQRARSHFGRALRHQVLSPRLLAYWCTAALLGIFKGKSA